MWRPEIQIFCKGPESGFPVKIIDLVLDRNPAAKHPVLRNTLTSCSMKAGKASRQLLLRFKS